MLFGCCYRALGVEARLALTLRAVVGMTTPQIASAFVMPEATMAQRLVRAKRKITSAGIPFTIPDADDLAPRLDHVLTVIYLSYHAGLFGALCVWTGIECGCYLASRVGGPRLAGSSRGLGLTRTVDLPLFPHPVTLR